MLIRISCLLIYCFVCCLFGSKLGHSTLKTIVCSKMNNLNDIPRNRHLLQNATLFPLKDGDVVGLTHCAGFNRLYVMPCVEDGKLIELADDIQLCEETQGPLTQLPDLGEIILTKYGMNGLLPKYYRSVVRSLLSSKDKLIVRMLDAGEEIVVNLSDCKLANEAVAKHPIYSRSVLLDGIPESPADLMIAKVIKYFTSIANQKLRLEVVKQGQHPSSTPVAKLYYRDMQKPSHSQETCVNTELFCTATMFWEKSFQCGNYTEEAIFKDLQPNIRPIMMSDLPVQKIPLYEVLPIKIAKYSSPRCLICVPQLPKFEHDLDVLNRQIKKYTETVSADEYFPMINEVVLMKDGRDPSSIWVRGAHCVSENLGDTIYAVDYGYFVPIEFCHMRRIPFEFTRVGTFAVFATITGYQVSYLTSKEIFQALEKIIIISTVHMMMAVAVDPFSAIVEFSYPMLEEKLLQALHAEEEKST